MIRCTVCAGLVAPSAISCPHCGSRYFRPGSPMVHVALVVILVAMFFIFWGAIHHDFRRGEWDERHWGRRW